MEPSAPPIERVSAPSAASTDSLTPTGGTGAPLDEGQRARLEGWIARRLARPGLRIEVVEPLGGGSIQENLRLRCRMDDGAPRHLVLRKDAPATIASSLSRAEEFAVLEVAHAAGVLVPEPVGHCAEAGVIGAPFSLMALVDGVGLGPRVAKDLALGGDRTSLARRLGAEIAKVHAVRPPNAALGFLGDPPAEPARAEVEALRAALDRLGVERPAIEWGLRWAELHAPSCPAVTLTHRDYRTGNYMVDADGLTAVIDWEFAGWSHPMLDLGWFCAACWRFGRPALEAGGIAPRRAFYDGYEAASGAPVDDAAVRYWEVMAHLRWAVIALEQARRHTSGREASLELALTGRMVPELERAMLLATAPDRWRSPHA
ncbi:phosphotransferase family protein [Lichenibacterium dinghuense]|uniref:phosphotransferase family protein n=1 Tax=Lichenibacterium dinghuense TaxID=2895977 RepID=UPI001F3FB744|nr:phosphotransferase family protein [Lichenibacterium sp. 6Y81]